MQSTLFRRLAPFALAVISLSAMANSGSTGALLRGCAARDLQILTMIEDRENSGAVSAESVREALLAMMHARIVCHEGHVADALALYDGIAQSIIADQLLSGYPQPREIQ
jgi:hypothetical protein